MARGDRKTAAVTTEIAPRVRGRSRAVLTAAATRLSLADRKTVAKQASRRMEWQDEAWDYFDEVPEIKYACWFTGNAMAKLTLWAGVRPAADPDGPPVPVDDPETGISPELARDARELLDELKSPLGGRPELLRMLSLNLEIAAECYLIGIGPRDLPDGSQTPQEWDVRSVSEVNVVEGKVIVTDRPGATGTQLDPERDVAIRIWQRHPRYSSLPDCNMRGVLSECENLLLLSNEVKAVAKSRQSAGAFTVPNELSFGGNEIEDDAQDSGEEQPDPFDTELMKALTDPVEDSASAAAVMPMLIKGPAEFLKPEYLRAISFARDSGADLDARIEGRVERVARGLNLPVEVVKGHANTTFANAGQINEDTFEDHLEPRCVLICDVIALAYLRPALLDRGHDAIDVERIVAWYNPSDIIGKTDPKESADYGLDHDTISEEAWRRVKGFSEDDAPDIIERLFRLVTKTKAIDPSIFAAILDLQGIKLKLEAVPGAGAPAAAASTDTRLVQDYLAALPELRMNLQPAALTATPQHVASTSTVTRRPIELGRDLAAIDRDLRARIIDAASEALDKSLVRAGNRLKARNSTVRDQLRSVHPLRAAASLGPAVLAAAGFTADDLIGGDAWDQLGVKFDKWVSAAQERALGKVAKVAGLSADVRAATSTKLAAARVEAWAHMRDAMDALAAERLYGPDPYATTVGESDPTTSVPAGLVRQALAVAGGAHGMETIRARATYVAIENGEPLGGVATGDILGDTLSEAGVEGEGYEWSYGPAYRAAPFEDHEALDGVQFANFDDEALSAVGSWIPFDYFFPGDHDGCICDFIPIYTMAVDTPAGDSSESDLSSLFSDVSFLDTGEGEIATHDANGEPFAFGDSQARRDFIATHGARGQQYVDVIETFTGHTFDAEELIAAAEAQSTDDGRFFAKALAEAPTIDSTLYRGVSVSPDVAESLRAYTPGDAFAMRPSSFSLSQDIGVDFTKLQNRTDVRVLFEVGPGASGLPVGDLSAFPHEREVITGGNYRIESVSSETINGVEVLRVKMKAL